MTFDTVKFDTIFVAIFTSRERILGGIIDNVAANYIFATYIFRKLMHR